jgi:hypothetical protein
MSAEQSEPATNLFKSGRRVVPVEVSVCRYEPAPGAVQDNIRVGVKDPGGEEEDEDSLRATLWWNRYLGPLRPVSQLSHEWEQSYYDPQ